MITYNPLKRVTVITDLFDAETIVNEFNKVNRMRGLIISFQKSDDEYIIYTETEFDIDQFMMLLAFIHGYMVGAKKAFEKMNEFINNIGRSVE